MEVGYYRNQGLECILIDEAGHAEVEGTLGQYRRSDGVGGMYLVESVDDVWELEVKNPEFLAYVTQTTLSVDETAEIINALDKRFTKIIGPKKEDICYAAQNRQNAVKRLVDDCDLILVVGSHHSHNSARLKDVAEKHGVPAYRQRAPAPVGAKHGDGGGGGRCLCPGGPRRAGYRAASRMGWHAGTRRS